MQTKLISALLVCTFHLSFEYQQIPIPPWTSSLRSSPPRYFETTSTPRALPQLLPNVGESYDFVVGMMKNVPTWSKNLLKPTVGGGTAGCALAARLSENGRYSVVILEYGDYPNPGLDIPALFGEYLNDENRKIYRSVPQSDGSLANNGTFNYLVGHQLGGTSGLNGMFFNRGSPHTYNEWAKQTNDPSWNYANLLKYFRKLEDYQGNFHSNGQHGFGGPITVSRPQYAPGLEQWLDAGRYLGYPIADPNGPQQVSFTPVEFTKRFGRRVSSFTGYIKPMLDTGSFPKLKIIVKAEVKRVIFAGTKAIGVVYAERDGRRKNLFIRAKKEVILSAGVINSPVILMRSGIGPRVMLQSANIPVVRSLPVGRNLQDHMVLRLNIILGNRSATFIPERDLTPENFRLYNLTGDGPYSSYQGTPGQAFVPSSLATRQDWADIQISFLQSPGASSVIVGSDQTQDIEVAPWEVLVSCAVYLVVPKSRGYVALNNTNIDQGDPAINFRYLSHPDDIQVLVEAVKKALTIFEDTPAYRKMGTRYPPNPHPSCSHLQFRSDSYWKCLIRQVAGSGSHGVGTCKMGRENDPESVVNPQLKVLGFQNLRVVDASTIPFVPNCNTQAAVYVLTEKAADMILSAWS